MNDVIIKTLEIKGDQEIVASWIVPETLPFNQFAEMIANQEKKKNILIGINGADMLMYELREINFAKYN